MNDKLEQLREMIDSSHKIVFFGGAGVSTESGIPDFRSVDGLYNQKYKYPPETILSHSFFVSNPDEFYRFAFDKLVVEGIEPNSTHYKLAELERQGKLTAVITQNIDGLHQTAGSKNVYELHGTMHRFYCCKCGKEYGEEILDARCTPYCTCGGLIRPDVVLYEEPLKQEVFTNAMHAIAEADMLIIGGTSLVVYPAAGLIRHYKGQRLVLINKQATPYDSYAALTINKPLGEVFSKI